jgi:hypothetical protein
MRFTEHELTMAVTGAAKRVMAAKKFRRRGVDVDTAWDAMDRYQRFKLLDSVGSQILPVLVALPDVEVAPGSRPSYSTRQVQAVVAELVGHDLGRFQRLATVKARTALVQTALEHVPPRPDPDVLGTTQEP